MAQINTPGATANGRGARRLLLSAAACCCLAAPVLAGDPPGRQWWPSEWGAEDQRGALNRLTPDRVLAAARLVTRGKIYDLGRVVEEDMPLFNLTPGRRKYSLTVPGAPSWGPLGRNGLAWNEDYIAGHITQNGTQFDALSHMATVTGAPGDLGELRYYNGHRHADIGGGRGFRKLGVEHVTPIFTRGVLIDAAGLKGRRLECDEEVTTADLEAALARQGLSAASIQPGDALFYHTGWGELWETDHEKFNRCVPGLTAAAGDWVVAKKVLLVGVDNWAVETIPAVRPDAPFAPNHQKFLVENGIYIMENMDFSALLQDRVYEFAFAFGAIPFKGATGSPARPFALR